MHERCSQQWFFRYIEGIKIPPGIAAHIGSGVHKGAEVDLITKRDTGEHEPESVVLDAAADGYDRRLSDDGVYLTKEEKTKASKLLGEGKDKTVKLAKTWYNELAQKLHPKLVEESISITIPEIDIPLLGIVDLLEEDNTLRDLKTTGRKWNQQNADMSLQPTMYRELIKQLIGEYPKEIVFDVLVNKKEPEVQRMSTVREDSDMDTLVLRIQSMLQQVEAGITRPADPGSWICSSRFCGYWSSMCPYISDRQRQLPRIK
jgi:hypothetical protein